MSEPDRKPGVKLALLLAIFCAPASAGELKTYKLRHGGYDRVYRVYAPANLDKAKKYPLLFVLHGGGGSGRNMPRLTRSGFERLADGEGALLAYPDGVDGHWNDYRGDEGRKAVRENIDDVAFLAAAADEIAKKYPADPARVYAAGISNGAMMSYALACLAADKFAAIAPVAGALPERLAPACRPARPVPVLMVNGTDDKLVHWEGGYVTGPLGKKKMGRLLPVEKTRDFWLAADSCDAAKKGVVELDADPKDGTSVTRENYPACAGGAAVEFLKIDGGGHTWPGGLQYRSRAVIGRTSREFDAAAEIWKFLIKYSLPAGGGK
ncbi:MAG: PHB depolymerase family esterase [Elusimicrobiales bacterium]|nr:PHB depolymerase family esterase [Elusimicrobiales bacterium]